MTTSWRELSRQKISKVLRNMEDQGLVDDIDRVMRNISLHYYPFGERRYYPYKAWLQAIQDEKRAYCRRHSLPYRPPGYTEPKAGKGESINLFPETRPQ